MITVTECIYIKELLYYVELSNGSKGLVDFFPLTDEHVEFRQISDEDKGEQYYLDGYTIEWYNGSDIAPEWINKQLSHKVA